MACRTGAGDGVPGPLSLSLFSVFEKISTQCLSIEETMNQRATHSPSWCLRHLGFLSCLKSCFYHTSISIQFWSFFFPLDHVSEAFQPCLLQPGNGHIVYLHLALSLDACVASHFIISEAEAKICFLSGYNENNMDSYISNTQQSWRRGNSHTVTLFPPRFPTYPLLEDSFCF